MHPWPTTLVALTRGTNVKIEEEMYRNLGHFEGSSWTCCSAHLTAADAGVPSRGHSLASAYEGGEVRTPLRVEDHQRDVQ
jgi:hypothetical protein